MSDIADLLNRHRAFLVNRLADVDKATPGTPDLGAVTVAVELVSKHVDTQLAEAGADVLLPFDTPPRHDFDEARRTIQARLVDVDAALAGE